VTRGPSCHAARAVFLLSSVRVGKKFVHCLGLFEVMLLDVKQIKCSSDGVAQLSSTLGTEDPGSKPAGV
jgi:hypothetical protein